MTENSQQNHKADQDILHANDVFPPYNNKPAGIKDFDLSQDQQNLVPKKQEIPEFEIDKEMFVNQRQLTSQKRVGPGKPATSIPPKSSQSTVEEFLKAVMPQSDATPSAPPAETAPAQEVKEQFTPKISPTPAVAAGSDRISTQVKNLMTRNEEAVIMDIVSRDIANFLRQGAA